MLWLETTGLLAASAYGYTNRTTTTTTKNQQKVVLLLNGKTQTFCHRDGKLTDTPTQNTFQIDKNPSHSTFFFCMMLSKLPEIFM
jgi:hypothetical protein